MNHAARIGGCIYANCPDPDLRTFLADVTVAEEFPTQCGSDSHI